MATFPGWEQAILQAIGAPITKENIRFLDNWQRGEGGAASYNPLNTTQPAPGATSYNSVGVRNYPSVAEGVAATAQTLQNGLYPELLAGLRSGNIWHAYTTNPRAGLQMTQEVHKWGTSLNPFADAEAAAKYGAVNAGTIITPVGGISGILGTAIGGTAVQAQTPQGVTGLLSGINTPLDFLKKLLSIGGLQMLAGAVLILVGVILLARNVGLSPSEPAAVRVITDRVS